MKGISNVYFYMPDEKKDNDKLQGISTVNTNNWVSLLRLKIKVNGAIIKSIQSYKSKNKIIR